MRSTLVIAVGAIVFAATIFAVVAAPGFLSDGASTVPVGPYTREAGQ